MSEAVEYLSSSSVKKFASCPKSYEYRYVRGYEVPEPEENKYIKRGNVVHNVLEELLESDSELSNTDSVHQFLLDNCSDAYSTSMASDVEDCLEMAAKYTVNYVEDVRDVEERWSMDHGDIDLVGYADLIDGDTIVDWKTGKSEGKELDEKIQASFYIKLFENEYEHLPEKVEFVYLTEGELSTHNRITDDGEVMWNNHQNKYWKEVESIISQIQMAHNQDNWEAQPGNCYFCEFKNACSDYVGSENVTRQQIEIGI